MIKIYSEPLSKGDIIKSNFYFNNPNIFLTNPILSLFPALWLDANDSSTITVESGAVSEWRDKSGNNHHATQTTANNRPLLVAGELNGTNVIRFDGVDDLLQADYSINNFTQATLIALAKRCTINSIILSTEYITFPNQGVLLLSSLNSNAIGGRPHGGSSYIVTTLPNNNTYNILIGEVTNGYINIIANGIVGTPTNFSVSSIVSGTKVNIGRNAGPGTLDLPSNPDISQIIIFPRILSQAEREQVEGYLAHATGLQGNLPSDHPYKTVAP